MNRLAKTALVVLVCLGWSGAALADEEAGLTIKDAWVRAMPPTMKNTAAYLSVANTSEQAVAIVGATADAADKVELHTTRMVDGLVRMEPLSGLALAPGEITVLEPGGAHLMLLGLRYTLQPDDEVELCLQTAKGRESCATAIVHKDGSAGGGHHQHH